MAYENLKNAIKQVIKQNGNHEITGDIMQSTLLSIVNTIGADYKFLGIATPSTVPSVSEGKLLYFASESGEYTNFLTSGENTWIVIGNGLYMLTKEANSNYWKEEVLIDIEDKISALEDKTSALESSVYSYSKLTDDVYTQDFTENFSILDGEISLDNRYYCNGLMTNLQIATLESVIVNSKGATSVSLCIASINGNRYKIVKNLGNFNINASGSTTISFTKSDVFVLKNQGVFIKFSGGAFAFRHKDNYNAGLEFIVGSTVLVHNDSDVVVSYKCNFKSGFKLFSNVNLYQYIKSLEDKTSVLEDKTSTLDDKTEYIEVFHDDFSVKLSDWVFGETWQFDTALNTLKPTTVGSINTNVIRLNRVYQCDKHMLRIKAILYKDSIFNIAAQRTNNNTGEGESFWSVDCKNKKLIMYKSGHNYRGVDISSIQASADISVVDGREYIIEIEKNDFTFYLKLHDTITGESTVLKNVGWDAGRLQFYYTFSLGGGTPFIITDIKVLMINNPTVVFAGDSITEGVMMSSIDFNNDENNLNNRYAEILRTDIKKSCISAVGGDIIDTIILKFKSEYNLIRPKYLSINIGTIGGINTNTEDKFKNIISLCENIKCIPIINIISCGLSGNYIEVNKMLLNLSKSKEYKNKFLYSRLDYCTSVDNYPWVDSNHPTTNPSRVTRVDTKSMVDGTHPNYIGSKKMADRFKIDVPEIFNY